MLGDLQNIEAEIVEILVDLEKPSIKPYPGERLKRMALAAQAIKQLCSSRELAGRIEELGCVQLQYGGRFEAITYVDGEALTVEERYKQLQAGVAGVSPAHSKALKKKEK